MGGVENYYFQGGENVKMVGEFFRNVVKNKVMLFMVLPGALWFLFFSYIPMFGTVIAFKEYRFHRDGCWASIVNSKWVGFDNFKFLFST